MSEPATKACPFCAEQIMGTAIKCKHCGSDLRPGAAAKPVTIEQTSKSVKIAKLAGWLTFWVAIIAAFASDHSPAAMSPWITLATLGIAVAVGARFAKWWRNG